jgi:3',5'-cyclic AMP phosphodiesterase CpdA
LRHAMIAPPATWRALFLLLAALPLLAEAATLRVAVISDLNSAYGSTRYEPGVAPAIARLVELHPDLVISTGDMVAGQRLHPPLERPAVLAMWAAFHAQVTDPVTAAGIPFAATPGNHDGSAYAGFALERAIYREQWQPRTQGLRFVDRGDFPFHYAFAMGDVLFVSLDATRVGALEPAQRAWLEALLEREGGNYRHRVVFGHLPVYPFAQGRETEVTADHDLERLLQRHGVELYLSGHHHAFYPGYHDGIRHVGQACLGAGPRKLIGDAARSERAVTWLEFDEDGTRIAALVVPQLERRIDFATLPASIRSRYGTLVRDDLRRQAPPGP